MLGFGITLLLVWQITHYAENEVWWAELKKNWSEVERVRYLLFALALVPVNWGLEAIKWRTLLRPYWPDLAWPQVIRAVLAGISVSVATPNRIGEYGGRALVVPSRRVADVVLTTVVGSMCQWVVFLACGWPGIVYSLGQHYITSTAGLFALALAVPALLWLGITQRHMLREVLRRIPIKRGQRWWRWLRFKVFELRRISIWALRQALFIALLRFLVYSCQYLLLLWFFGVSLSFVTGLAGIFSIYLIQAGIPLPPGLGVMTRSELAILIWGEQAVLPLAVVSATFSVYLINLVAPALLGVWMIVHNKKAKP